MVAICGIAGVHIKDASGIKSKETLNIMERFCDQLLLGIENRGQHATGFVAVDAEGGVVLDKNNVTASDFIRDRKFLPDHTRTVLLHTRFATQGEPEIWANNHPVFSGTTFTVHNGTIYNDAELFREHDIERIAQVDSEIIPALLNKYTLDKAPEAFAELGGGFATASVDPTRYPGVMVLGKGGSWPLVVLEAKQFLVFASTSEAIKKAWGKVFGTPPQSYEYLTDGEVWFCNQDQVERVKNAFVPAPFTRPSRFTGSTTRGTTTVTTGNEDPWDFGEENECGYPYRGYGERVVPAPKGATTTLDTTALVAEMVANKTSAAITYGRKGEGKNPEILEARGNQQWIYCVHCKRTVAAIHVFVDTKEHGSICVDCHAIASTQRATEPRDVSAWLEDNSLNMETYTSIKRIGDTATYIHNAVMRRMLLETGMEKHVIEFLLFRSELEYLEADENVQNMYCELSDLYMAFTAEEWQDFVQETEAEVTEAEAEATEVKVYKYENQADGKTWVACVSGLHPEDESCPTCGEPPMEGVVVEEVEVEAEEILGRCSLCRRKAKTMIRGVSFCNRHFNRCYEAGCRSEPKGTTASGSRVCHTHSRGVKGYMADTAELERV